jgi:tRNA threonylcarbamoyladenosine modification (KEOPS) complex  Pcc1 subunit
LALKAVATVRLRFSSEKQLAALVDALKPEIKKHITTRSEVTLVKDSLFLVLTVEAKDTVALRATLNAYLRWISSTVNVLEALENSP